MAKKQIILDNAPLDTQLAMADTFASLQRWGFLSRTQLATLMDATRPHLPCAATVVMRTHKGMAYVTLSNGVSFSITTRAQLAA